MQDGSFIGNFAPYGYKKDPDNKNLLIVDTAAASVVQKIFELAAEGETPIQIARYLNDKGIITPAMYRCQSRSHLDVNKYSQRKEWTSASITKMLRNIVYLGHLAQGKTTKVSFKSNVTIQNDRGDWIVVHDTHEPIISKETFDMVRRRSISRTCHSKGVFVNIFSGIAKCKDCGRNMSAVGTRKKGSPANLACGGYKLYGRAECDNHFIDYNIIYDIVLEAIREQTAITEQDRQKLLDQLQKKSSVQKESASKRKELDTLKKRSAELDGIIEKLYEDNFGGVISDERFRKLLAKYEAESKTVSGQISILEDSIQDKKESESAMKQSLDKFISLIKEYTEIEALTPDILFKLIDRIEVSQGNYEKIESRKVKRQTVQIYFRFIGKPTIKQYTA
jgi:hypothetical protein